MTSVHSSTTAPVRATTVVAPGRPLTLALVTAILTGGLAVAGASALGLPLRDPDGFLGPSWLRLPLIVGACLLLDTTPRALWRTRGRLTDLPRALRAVAVERWPWARLVPVLVAVACFYVTYVGYRNLKNFLPFVFDRTHDVALVALDRTLTLGYDPGDVLHLLLGTGVTAQVLSWIYMVYLFFVPISVAVSLIFSKHLSYGLWYVSALCLNWSLGTISYYLIPASGPFWAMPWSFLDLERTDVTGLQEALLRNRAAVVADPYATSSVSGIAAFASLHVSVTFTAALVLHLVRARPLLRNAMWVYLALVVVSTVYFGWHYLIDVPAGMAIGAIAVWMGAWATGNLHLYRRSATPPVRRPESALAG
jgi:membrane-associated phospholipid phosphatase